MTKFSVIVQSTLTLTLSPHGARELKEQKPFVLPPGGGGSRWGGELLLKIQIINRPTAPLVIGILNLFEFWCLLFGIFLCFPRSSCPTF